MKLSHTLTTDQLKRLHGASNVEMDISFKNRELRVKIDCEWRGEPLQALWTDYIGSLDGNASNHDLSVAVERCLSGLVSAQFEKMRPELRQHLASLPPHALRKSIHQIEDEWQGALDEPWHAFVLREMELARLEYETP